MELNKKIKTLRLEKGITQTEISNILGIDQSTYAHYESGRRTPDIDKLKRLASYYGLTDELLDVNVSKPVFNGTPLYGKYYCFKRLYESPIELERIYPTRQALAIKLYETLHEDSRVISAMLFGSSITMKCRASSDIDLAIRLDEKFTDIETKNEISEAILNICNWNADILWFDRLNPGERIYTDICKGVQIA